MKIKKTRGHTTISTHTHTYLNIMANMSLDSERMPEHLERTQACMKGLHQASV